MKTSGDIALYSFGFKYGVPETNFYFDVTFLPNPARLAGKKLFDALDQDMYEYVRSTKVAQDLVLKIVDLIVYISEYDNIKIGIGCNSGRHRSVIIVLEIEERLKALGIQCSVTHRDLV